MKKIFFSAVILSVIFLFSCTGSTLPPYIPIPKSSFFEPRQENEIGTIIQTRDGDEKTMPLWLSAFLRGGIREAEELGAYSGKYLFIARSEGLNFQAMEKWAENFNPAYDVSNLAAGRIERRMISSALLYPDDEYGRFFETLMKNAYSTGYPGAQIEGTYWVKVLNEDGSEVYCFFVMVSMEKFLMQEIIEGAIIKSLSSVSPTNEQSAAINRLRQNFFEGF